MADIFVSYARADRALIAPLVAALEAQGLSVWWDPEIKAGQEFDQLISAEMAAAKAVIAVWTPTSVDSRWVRGEAREAADRGVLVPVRFGNARMPLDVRSLHTIELDDWREDKASAPFQELLRALTPLIGTKVPKAQTPASGGAPRVRMTTIVSLDVAGYSKRTEADEAAAARQIMALRSRLAAIAVRRGGRIFNTAGDSIMLEFAAAQEAVAAIFELLDDRPLSEPETRVGAHLGDVTVASNGDLLGHGVNVAARLMVQAQPGRALISSELKGALDHQIARPMRDMGELVLAKMDTRIHAFEIVPENAAPNKGLAKAKLKPRHALAIGGTALIVLLAGFLAMKAFVPNRTKPAAPMSAGTLPAASASRSPDTASLAPAKPRIAILPFENLSPDPNNAFFTDGMHEEILTALANAAPGLDVISRTTMDSYKGKPVTIEQLAKDLGCSHVLEGSVRREGNEVRLTLQLINARDDSHVWAEDYDRKLTSAMALQSEVAKKVAEQLSLKIAPRVQAAATNDPLAYDLYLKARLARQNLTGYSDVREWNGAIALLDQAIKLDPNFVQAYLARFDIHFWLFTANYDVSQGRLDLARADLSKAESLAPNDPSVIAAKAAWAFLEQDFSRALSLFEQAQSAGFADPNFLVWKASSFAAVGRFDRDLEAIRHAVALDPGNTNLLIVLGGSLFEAHQHAEALKVFDLAIARQPHDMALREYRDSTAFYLTGDATALDSYFVTDDEAAKKGPSTFAETFAAPSNQLGSPELTFWERLGYLIRKHRYAEARQVLDAWPSETFRAALGYSGPMYGIPPFPKGSERGWFDLLLGDRAAEQRDGEAVLKYARSQQITKWSQGYVLTFEAQGLLLTGDKSGAIKLCHEAIASAPYAESVTYRPIALENVYPVLAWAGATDEAVDILEQMSREAPGIPPSAVVSDPVIAVPLMNNRRYQDLKAKLEAQMAANAKLLGVVRPQ